MDICQVQAKKSLFYRPRPIRFGRKLMISRVPQRNQLENTAANVLASSRTHRLSVTMVRRGRITHREKRLPITDIMSRQPENIDAKDGVTAKTLALPPDAWSGPVRVHRAKLLMISGPRQGNEVLLTKDLLTIGSGPHNDLVLDDTTVSRRHCEIQLTPEGYLIRDLGSTNGTWVQGVRVTEAFLDQGTEFQLGKTRFVFCPLQEAAEFRISKSETFGRMIGPSFLMRRVFHLAETYAPTEATILIEGETGTGKEVLAEEIHNHSPRKDKPFVVIDCATLSRELVESELFGHTRGAFTGATTDRIGVFEHAHGGTVFLDEVGDLPPDLQPKLLRVLEKKEIRRVGSNVVRPIDVRIISATNRKLENEVNAGRFREDLLYRLSVVRIEIPPLKKRKEDLRPLTVQFLREFRGEDVLKDVENLDRAVEAFKNYDWPGNVRELRNLVEMAVYSERRPLDLASFLYISRQKTHEELARSDHIAERPFKEAKGELISEFETAYIREMLRKHGGNISKAARDAGIERAYLQRLIKKYGLKP